MLQLDDICRVARDSRAVPAAVATTTGPLVAATPAGGGPAGTVVSTIDAQGESDFER
jgi:hypothetical protein